MNFILSDEEMIRQHLTSTFTGCFEILYNRYAGKIYRQCFSITKDSSQAQDFTHDIFIRIFARLDQFRGQSSFSTWLYSISYNYCLDQLKRAKRLTTTYLNDDLDYHCTSTEESEKVDYSLYQLARVMNSISPLEATVLRLKYQDGLPLSQIGLQLNLKESAVKMRLKRSRKKVKQLCQTAMG
ncbi:MAG: RNA polymerase sigma factor [Proteobacteria bacterium]|nr:MAG: RNA polymerase sigma factor [Pseudomonadota bacterium]